MAEYIEREAVRAALQKYGFQAPDMTVTELVEDELTAADVAPVRHARWAKWHGDPRHYCAACGAYANAQRDATGYIEYDFLDSYCSDCGARMDGDEE